MYLQLTAANAEATGSLSASGRGRAAPSDGACPKQLGTKYQMFGLRADNCLVLGLLRSCL